LADRPASPPTRADAAAPAVADAHAYLLERFTALHEILLEEREALLGRAPERLEALVERKEVLCSDIASRQHTLLTALGPEPVLPESMDDLRSLAESCRSENALNGRIANRARRTTRRLLDALTGTPDDDAYDRPGQSSNRPRGTGHRLGTA
jgi:flagellar biosynthesis/type III secretory pathway chaperone